MGMLSEMDKGRKLLIIWACIFSAVYIIAMAVGEMNVSMAIFNIALWICICFAQNWAKLVKIVLNFIMLAVYAIAGCQLLVQYANSAEIPEFNIGFVLLLLFDIIRPLAEIMVLYKPKDVKSYFLKNKMNIK